jgi:hypothetical protein
MCYNDKVSPTLNIFLKPVIDYAFRMKSSAAASILDIIKKRYGLIQSATLLCTKKITRSIGYSYSLFLHRLYHVRYLFLSWLIKRGSIITVALLISLICFSIYQSSTLQDALASYFTDSKIIDNLRTLFISLGTALIGATAIAFSLVMFSMQVNVERMPHGLFRRFSADMRLMAAFGCTFFLAIAVACASLIDESYMAIAVLIAIWGTLLIFLLFLYAYRRALLLINPLKQLGFLVEGANHEMQTWVRRAKRATPLFDKDTIAHNDSTYDMYGDMYFQANPHWIIGAKRAIKHAVSFARRYAECGDHEVSGAALNAIININRHYVEAKGKTFFANHLMFDNTLSQDGFITDTLEHLRQNIRIGIARGDEQQMEQTLHAMVALVQTYMQIDYVSIQATKPHANRASGYLSEAVQDIAPHNMPDVVMEGVELMGKSAYLFLAYDQVTDIATIVEKIGFIACTGIVNEKYRPVMLVSLEQLTRLMLSLLLSKAHNIRFTARQVTQTINMIAKFFLTIPDTPLASIHSIYLAPYYSGTSTQAFQVQLVELVNKLAEAEANNEQAKIIIRNIEEWAEQLYITEKDLLLVAIQKRSHLTFDVIHWIAQITKILLAVSNLSCCPDHLKNKIRKHALSLISTLSWIPDDKETITFVEGYQMTELLFEAIKDAQKRDCLDISEEMQKLLLKWTFKAGKYHTGWATLEQSLYALVTLTLLSDFPGAIDILKTEISNHLNQPNSLDQSMRESAARNLRQQAAALYRIINSPCPIDYAMSQIDHTKLKQLLEEVAYILSPATAGDGLL